MKAKLLRFLTICFFATCLSACTSLSGYPTNPESEIQEILEAAPKITFEKPTSFLPVDKRYAEIRGHLNEAANIRLDRKHRFASSFREYARLYLYFYAYKDLERVIERLDTDRALDAKAYLANYYAIHGFCKNAEHYANDVIEANRLSVIPVDAISALAVCGFHDRYREIVQDYSGASAKYFDIGPFAKNETEAQFLYRQKIEFIVDAYSRVGTSLFKMGNKLAAAEYIKFAQSVVLKQKGDLRDRVYVRVYKNLLQANLTKEAHEFLKALNNSALDFRDTFYLSRGYALEGNAEKVFEVAKETLYEWGRSRSTQGKIAQDSIYFLTKKNSSPDYLDQLEDVLFQKPYKDAENIYALSELAVANAEIGRKDRADKLIAKARDQLDEFYGGSFLSDAMARSQKIAEAYVLIDKNPYRSYEFMTDKKYFRDVNNNQSWGYVLGAARLIDDRSLLKKLDGDLPRYDFYTAGEVKYLISVNEFEKALTLIQSKGLEGYKEGLLTLLAFKKVGASEQEFRYLSNVDNLGKS